MDHDALRSVGVGRMRDRLTLLGRARDALLIMRENAEGVGGARVPQTSHSDRELIDQLRCILRPSTLLKLCQRKTLTRRSCRLY